MLFRPSFCAHCGEKIDRAEWGVFTSRRFCQVCESEFKGQDLIPRFIVGLGVLIGIFGFGGYLKSGSDVSETKLVRQPKKLVEEPGPVAQQAPGQKIGAVPSNTSVTTQMPPMPDTLNKVPAFKTDVRGQESQRSAKFEVEPVEEVYFCGASTVKGTPCKRRVKGSVRCYQHIGMPALVPPDKLRIK